MEPFLPRGVGIVMSLLFLAALAAPHPTDLHAALRLCRPALARKAGGQIATMNATSSLASPRGLTVEGRLTAFLGMGPPPPGSASAHHLIRADFNYRCTVRRHAVRSATVVPVGG
jgi:hypothetical protein